MMKRELLEKVARLEERVRVLADGGELDEEGLLEFEKVLAELEMLVR